MWTPEGWGAGSATRLIAPIDGGFGALYNRADIGEGNAHNGSIMVNTGA